MSMKTLYTASLIILLLFLASCGKSGNQSTPEHQEHVAAADAPAVKEYYTCPMHPSVISDRPGACPICGMALVRKKAASPATAADQGGPASVKLSPAQRVMANVSTVRATRRHFQHTMNAVGVIDYAEPAQAKVTARFRGRIQRLFVDFTGGRVRKGQPLFELYSPDLATAEREFVLALQAQDTGGGIGTGDATGSAREEFLQAARERLTVHFGLTAEQVAEIEQKRESGSTVVFNSPIHGTVLSKEVQEGEYVDEGIVLYQLADLSRVWAYLDTYESDISSMRVGQAVTITADAYPGRTFPGRVAFIDAVIDPQTRTVRVRAELDNRDQLLKPQMYVRASTRMDMGMAIVVPRSAVLITGNRSVVWVEVGENRFEPRAVDVGMSDDASIEIISGLADGEMVAVSGGFLLDSESVLQIPSTPDPHAGHDGMKKEPRP
jgi:Cu(I)/Ag(I) efflux system membrane fusion protein